MKMFTIDGQEVEPVQKLEDGTWAARPIWDYEGDERDEIDDYHFGAVEFYDRLFDEAPTNVWDKKVQELMAQVAGLEGRRAEMDAELRDAKRAHEAQMKQFAQVPELKNLEDLLAGRITHYAVFGYNPSIIPFDSTKAKDGGGYRLLTLFGKPHKSVSWWLNSYEDGSGANTLVTPCTSLKQAQNAVSAYISEQHRDGKLFALRRLEELVKQGVLIGDEIMAEARSETRKELAKSVEKAEQMLEEARKKLSAVEAA